MKKGSDAKITVRISGVDTECAGFATWSYSGEVRDLLTQVEFSTAYRQQESGIWEGGDIELTGFYKADSDAGQQFLKNAFRNATKLYVDDVRLYLDDTVFLTPDDNLTPASYIIITKYNDSAQDVSGVATFNMSMKVSGRLKENS
jgi:hypothetical protein